MSEFRDQDVDYRIEYARDGIHRLRLYGLMDEVNTVLTSNEVHILRAMLNTYIEEQIG